MEESRDLSPTLSGIYTVLILLYINDVILMAHTCESMNRLLQLLKAFRDRSGLTVNVAKTKMLMYTKEPAQTFEFEGRVIENVTEFKYLGIEIPSSYKWSKCMDRRLAVAKRMFYMLIRCIMFAAYVMQTKYSIVFYIV